MSAFSYALKVAIAKAGRSQNEVSRTLGYSESTLSAVVHGRNIPRPEMIARLAEELEAPHLVTLARKARTKTCDECHIIFQQKAGASPMRFCSARCKQQWRNRKERDDRRANIEYPLKSFQRKVDGLEKRLLAMTEDRNAAQEAIDRMCWTCEPEGFCRDATSPLRDRSPLPLADERLRIA